MPQKGILLFLLLLLSCPGFSQQHETDELIARLETAPDDISRVNLLIRLSTLLGESDYSKALYYAQEAQSLAHQLDYSKGVGDAYFVRSRVYYYKDEYPIAIQYLNQARDIYEKTGSKSGMADYYFGLGEIERLYGNYLEAVTAYQEAIKLEEQTGDTQGASICFNSLAVVHIKQKNFGIAMQYARKALPLQKKLKDELALSTTLNSIGRIFEGIQQPDSALLYYLEALHLRETIGNTRRIASSHFTIGKLYLKIKEPDEAVCHLSQALQLFQSLEEKTGIVITSLKISEANSLKGLFSIALKEADQALEIAKSTRNQTLIRECYQVLSKVYAEKRLFQQAYVYQTQFLDLTDSLFDEEKNRMLNELEMKYQVERKDHRIELLKSKNQLQQKNIIILFLLTGALLILTASLIYFNRLKSLSINHKNKLLEQEKVIHQKNNELRDKETRLLLEQLESKNKALTAKVLGILKTNEALDAIATKLASLTHKLDDKNKAAKEIASIINELERHSKDNLWEEFDKAFKGVHSEFYTQLLDKCPSLTPTEIKIAALLRLNLSTKEITAITFKSESGIKSARFRLRKKLGLPSDAGLVSFLMSL
jgi:tetratricopeptide (TPR) repeat protein